MISLMRIVAGIIALFATLTGMASAGPAVRTILTDQFDLVANGRHYRIFTAVPAVAAPAQGFPVVYMTDGNRMLPLASQAMHDDPQLQAVIVGIGYPSDDAQDIIRRRFFDLTPVTAPQFIPVRDDIPATGGQQEFFAFIQNEVKPQIEQRFSINRSHQSLFGHSLGGLFSLYVLFNHSSAFQAYSAGDPSIWWNDRSILADKQRFLAAPPQLQSPIPVLIETSGQRGERPTNAAAASTRAAQLRQGPGGAELFRELSELPYLRMGYHRFEAESHGSMIPRNVVDSLNFLLRGKNPATTPQ